MHQPPPTDLSNLSLVEIARMVAEQKLPPVESWNPAHCGHSDMRIASDGTWFHQGSPIGRPEMVRLFSTILRREPDGSHVLVTPVEKLDIDVDDAPFIAVEVRAEGDHEQGMLHFRLNTGDIVTAGPEHRIEMRVKGDDQRPYLHVRGGLDALIARPVFYELANVALDNMPSNDSNSIPSVWSDGCCFPLHIAEG